VEDSSSADRPVVALRGAQDSRRRLLFRDPVRPYADSPYEDETVRCVAEARDSGLEATIKIETCADDGLAGFLHELAEDFRAGQRPGSGAPCTIASSFGSRQPTIGSGM
jgi:hypothetical protein